MHKPRSLSYWIFPFHSDSENEESAAEPEERFDEKVKDELLFITIAIWFWFFMSICETNIWSDETSVKHDWILLYVRFCLYYHPYHVVLSFQSRSTLLWEVRHMIITSSIPVRRSSCSSHCHLSFGKITHLENRYYAAVFFFTENELVKPFKNWERIRFAPHLRCTLPPPWWWGLSLPLWD